MSSVLSLSDRHTDATRELIIGTAVELLEKTGVTDLTVRAVAKKAGMSERTIFRYFATREEFLDAVAADTARRVQAPPPPVSINELENFPDPLYRSFEEMSGLVRAALHTEIYSRVRRSSAGGRWEAVASLIDKNAKHRSKMDRKIATLNVNYYLSATTWHYLRFNFELSLDEAILCARSAVRLTVENILDTECT